MHFLEFQTVVHTKINFISRLAMDYWTVSFQAKDWRDAVLVLIHNLPETGSFTLICHECCKYNCHGPSVTW